MSQQHSTDPVQLGGEPRPEPAPAFPVTVVLASLIWVGFGLLAVVLTVVNTILRAPTAGMQLILTICSGLIGIVFVLAGVLTIRGRLPSLVGPALGSFLFSFYYFGMGFVAANIATDTSALLLVSCAALGGSLLIAALCTLIGQAKYLRWRAAHGLPRPD